MDIKAIEPAVKRSEEDSRGFQPSRAKATPRLINMLKGTSGVEL